MSELRQEALRLLESVGGDVEIEEVRYHLGALAPTELMEAAVAGLVDVKTFFSLTDRGRELIASPSPEGFPARHPAEEAGGSPAPGPGGAGTDLPPTGFAACHGGS